jgi:transposase
VSKTYRPWTPTQSYLLPPSPAEWLPEGHLAFFLLDVVQTLDVTAIEREISRKDPRGEKPYSPRLLTALLLYGYAVGVFSSRKMAKATYEDVAFRVLCGESHPHFTTINQFRLDYREWLAKLFVQVLRMCERAGLVKLGHVALDGTKILANASKHKAMSHERMTKEEARLRAEVDALLARAEQVDREEDERYGVGINPTDLPAELHRRETRLARIQEVKAELEREAAAARAAELRDAARAQDEKASDSTVNAVERRRAATRARQRREEASRLDSRDDDDDAGGASGATLSLPFHRVPHKPDGTPTPQAQRNFTDADSRIMLSGGGFVQAYNAQIVVDAESQVIVAEAVTNQPPDAEHLDPMMGQVIENSNGRVPRYLSADTGYFSEENVRSCDGRGVEPLLAVGRTKHGQSPNPLPAKPTTMKERMAAKLTTAEGRALYSRRKVIVEPPFGQIKECRGFRRFSLRGLAKVRFEWSFVCLTHNLLKLYRSGWRLALV